MTTTMHIYLLTSAVQPDFSALVVAPDRETALSWLGDTVEQPKLQWQGLTEAMKYLRDTQCLLLYNPSGLRVPQLVKQYPYLEQLFALDKKLNSKTNLHQEFYEYNWFYGGAQGNLLNWED